MELHMGCETRLTVKEAVGLIQDRTGRRPGLPTVYRWILKGVRGHRLASSFAGGIRLISVRDIDAFLAACNERSGGTAASSVVHAAPHHSSAGRSSLRRKQIRENAEYLRRQFRIDA